MGKAGFVALSDILMFPVYWHTPGCQRRRTPVTKVETRRSLSEQAQVYPDSSSKEKSIPVGFVVGFVSRLVIISAENMASCRIVRRLLDLLAKDVSLVMMVPNLPVDTNNHLGRAWRLIRSASIGFLVFKFLEIHVHHVIAWISGATIWQQARGHGVKIRLYRSAADDNFL